MQKLQRTVTAFLPIRPKPLLPAYDYVVVGAGSAGCVVASRLSEDPDVNVLLLEAGRQDNHPFIHLPVLYFKAIGNSRFDWKYAIEKETSGLSGRSINWPRGKGLGGSSSINGLLYIRGQPQDYDDWAVENPGWSWEDMLPHFQRAEDNESLGQMPGFSEKFHSHGGPQAVSAGRFHTELAERWMEACSEALNIPKCDDVNGAEIECVGYFQQLTQTIGMWPFRCSSAVSYLHSIRRSRPNLHIMPKAEVMNLEFSDQSETTLRAEGIQFSRDGEVQMARLAPGGEVVLAAGAMGSPEILMRSGIGPEDSLRAAGVTPRSILTGVGKNLQDHLQLRAKYAVEGAATLNTRARGLGYLGIGADYAFRGRGPATMAASQVCAFARSEAAKDGRPDFQFHFQPLSTSGSPSIHLDDFDAFTASVCQLRPTSRGYLTLRPNGEPGLHIHAHYLETPEDQACAAASLRAARKVSEVLGSNGAGLKVREIGPGPDAVNDASLVQWARQYGESIYHPVGTCKMGPASDESAVVDHRLQVHGIEGVRVADCAMMPTLVSGNTHAPAQAIGEKASDMIKADRAEKC
jgi:choline dehydrogenase